VTRWLALLGALLLAAPAAAQDKPAWVGVWQGKVGKYPVRLCIEGDDIPGRGSYYYLSRLEPISLSEEDGEGGWIERAAETEARWEFAEQTGQRLKGTWRQGKRSLPFDLKPIAWTKGDWGGPCSAAAFVEPLMAGGSVAEKPAEFEGQSYAEQSYVPPKHFADDDVSIDTFTFAETKPGDAAINAKLRAALPQGTSGDDLYGCMAGALSSLGLDGFFDHSLKPTLFSDAFIVAEDSSGNFCGGAHPNYYTFDRTFDRRTGEEIDLFDWIGEARIDGGDSTLDPRLRALVVARWPTDAEADCRELAATTEYWSLGLAREGLVFRPDFPHVATACEEPVTVEWTALAPFLDKDGRAGLARLRD
jgi:hypothetical protein